MLLGIPLKDFLLLALSAYVCKISERQMLKIHTIFFYHLEIGSIKKCLYSNVVLQTVVVVIFKKCNCLV